MSRMNDLATMLEEFTQATGQLLDAAARLHDVTGRLTAALTKAGDDKQKAGRKKPDEPEPKPADSDPVTTPEPEAGPEPAPEPAAPQYTKEQVRGMLSGLAGNGHRDEAKALVAKYANGGSFSDIDPVRYPELAEEVKQYA